MTTTDATATWPPAHPGRLGRRFKRSGWIGFWLQIIMLIVPAALLIYLAVVSDAQLFEPGNLDLANYLSYGSLVVMVFTLFWFYRYTRMGWRFYDPDRTPSLGSVKRTLWTGLWASVLGIVFAMVLIIAAVGGLLMILLETPEAGVAVTGTGAEDPATVISAVDGVGMSALIATLSAELVLLGLTLGLLFRVGRLMAAAEVSR